VLCAVQLRCARHLTATRARHFWLLWRVSVIIMTDDVDFSQNRCSTINDYEAEACQVRLLLKVLAGCAYIIALGLLLRADPNGGDGTLNFTPNNPSDVPASCDGRGESFWKNEDERSVWIERGSPRRCDGTRRRTVSIARFSSDKGFR
jgi:hypothetical protein